MSITRFYNEKVTTHRDLSKAKKLNAIKIK